MITYKKVGAIRFVKLGRFGFSFWVAKKRVAHKTVRVAAKKAPDAWTILRQGV